MIPRVRAAVEGALGASVRRVASVSGGDINDAYRVELSDGREVFVKQNAGANPDMFPAEARGLEWLREAEALTIPRVLAVSSGKPGDPAFLVLEYLGPSRTVPDFDVLVGRGLAKLHRFGAPSYGLDHDNFIGRLPQKNTPRPTWATFYAQERLLAQLALAEEQGRATAALREGLHRLCELLPDLVGPEEPPARLHGDLWGGNLHVADGRPCLIDPAVYGGHREIDLAMMRLFGGFSDRCFDAYREAYPLLAGYEDRVPLYQLYPLLVHLNLFGGSYGASAERIVRRYI